MAVTNGPLFRDFHVKIPLNNFGEGHDEEGMTALRMHSFEFECLDSVVVICAFLVALRGGIGAGTCVGGNIICEGITHSQQGRIRP
jgi:hypothetical protein